MALNPQGSAKAPRGSIEWSHVFGDRTGYTWNPISGCDHGCEWVMPHGARAICYAKELAERMRGPNFFPRGFETITFHEARLTDPLKLYAPAGIFLDSMSDLFSARVPLEHIQQVLEVCRIAEWHTFFALTKNAMRLYQVMSAIPPNVWVGASTPPDVMFHKPLSRNQQERMLHRALTALEATPVPVRWLSAEPLSWDIAPVLREHPKAINWLVIGAASRGTQHFAPSPEALANTLAAADELGIAVFFKGNLRCAPLAAANWREDYPAAGRNEAALARMANPTPQKRVFEPESVQASDGAGRVQGRLL